MSQHGHAAWFLGSVPGLGFLRPGSWACCLSLVPGPGSLGPGSPGPGSWAQFLDLVPLGLVPGPVV